METDILHSTYSEGLYGAEQVTLSRCTDLKETGVTRFKEDEFLTIFVKNPRLQKLPWRIPEKSQDSIGCVEFLEY